MMTGREASPQRQGAPRKTFARPKAAPQKARSGLVVSQRALIAAAGVGFAVFVWAMGATGLIVFGDDVVSVMIRREASLSHDYETRISTLKSELSRIKSKQLVDQQAFSEKVETLMRRQSSLESRQSIVQSLGEIANSVGVKSETRHAAEPAPTSPQPLPSEDSIEVVRPGKQAALELKRPTFASMMGTATATEQPRRPGVAERLASLSGELDGIERQQIQALSAIGSTARSRVIAIRDALDDVGVNSDRLMHASIANASEGGPFIPLELAPDASAFEAIAYEVQKAVSEADSLNRSLNSIPLRRPFADAPITSGFGARVDPFLGRTALHAGIDFREETGEPVRATASGKVTEAGWSGGYGNMVEIDHGSGISTRFGHMSEILVAVGQTVHIGDVIGRVGSTGRSTGPHLHYETRVGGVAIDPMRFLRAERKISEAM